MNSQLQIGFKNPPPTPEKWASSCALEWVELARCATPPPLPYRGVAGAAPWPVMAPYDHKEKVS
ncbi:hypothetical protein FH972_016815 [Carpinus fangiana]|uniref:Uncharacterized protein n=1 Tax=Carpinus fangiana TaxID=176857 RepID=A0A5N6RHI9_9ROSI|nr:hypothetical protein FH972_016815 [Carpinus fangiana]